MRRFFHVAAYFTVEAAGRREHLSAEWNEHLRQDHPRLKIAGALSGEDGAALGVMTIVEAENLRQAQTYFDDSPYQKAGLYEAVRVCEVKLEVGSLN